MIITRLTGKGDYYQIYWLIKVCGSTPTETKEKVRCQQHYKLRLSVVYPKIGYPVVKLGTDSQKTSISGSTQICI